MIGLGCVAIIMFALALFSQRLNISVIIRKDPDMATIKERLATLEAAVAAHATVVDGAASATDLSSLKDQVGDLAATVGTRLDGIDAEIGTDAPAADASTLNLTADQQVAAG